MRKEYVKVYLIATLFILLFSRLGLAKDIINYNSLNEEEVYCKYKDFNDQLESELKGKLDNATKKKEIYNACVRSSYIKCHFRRRLCLEYNIKGVQLERIIKRAKTEGWTCSWLD